MIVLVAATVIGLSVIMKVMSNKTTETITEVGNVYMTGLNERMSMHFEATIESRLSRLEYIIGAYPPGEYGEDEYAQLKNDMAYAAEARGLTYLAFYSTDGDFETLYGDPVELANPDDFLESMNNGDTRVSAGTGSDGESVALMGISCEYTLENGDKSTALVAGISMDYLKQLLALDSDDTIVYSHIIRRDGTYVMKSRNDTNDDNFLDVLRGHTIEGHVHSSGSCEEKFKAAMEKEEDFSAVFLLENDTREHIYCTSLPYSDWYLITIMPYGALDASINDMSTERNQIMFSYLGIMLLIMLVIFALYFRMTRNHTRELEKARSQALEASRAKSNFLSNMSHDIRTPMNAIVGMTAIAAANIDNTQKLEDCLRKIALSSRHLLGLINDVLDMSTIESGNMTLNTELVSLRDAMEGLVGIVQPQIKAKDQIFDITIKNIEAENIYCDSVRLNQVLINLLSNAVKFTPEGGRISINLSEEDSPLGAKYTRIHLSVADTGIGMTEEFKEKIFDSFAREDNKRVQKTEGTGLGMAITKHIIDAMGGTIEVESSPGKGTVFNITVDAEIADIEEEDMKLPNWRMLVVDDDKTLCETAVSELISIGLDAESTYDGESAVEMVYKRHISHDDYHIVLIDWQMPGIDGIETARRIRKKVGDDVPILIISAYDWSDIEEEARAAGVNGFICKPLFKSTLFYGIKQYTQHGGDVELPTLPERKTGFEGRRIIIAEDNDLNWEIAYELLSQIGLEIERAENGRVCVDMFERSEIGFYDAILMDIRMPVMTGYEAAEAIRQSERTDSDIPIIAMTADAFAEDIKRCIDGGMNAHIAKPIDISEVERVLDRFMK
jgi:signal transduction histidine kinase/DNA-binding response OmpR family regulator